MRETQYWKTWIFMWIGTKLIGFPFVDLYSPDRENIEAITFSFNEEYAERIGKIELTPQKETKQEE